MWKYMTGKQPYWAFPKLRYTIYAKQENYPGKAQKPIVKLFSVRLGTT